MRAETVLYVLIVNPAVQLEKREGEDDIPGESLYFKTPSLIAREADDSPELGPLSYKLGESVTLDTAIRTMGFDGD